MPAFLELMMQSAGLWIGLDSARFNVPRNTW